MNKRFLSVILAASLTLLSSACTGSKSGGDSDNVDNSGKNNNSQTLTTNPANISI